jgi:hypothetical protein
MRDVEVAEFGQVVEREMCSVGGTRTAHLGSVRFDWDEEMIPRL